MISQFFIGTASDADLLGNASSNMRRAPGLGMLVIYGAQHGDKDGTLQVKVGSDEVLETSEMPVISVAGAFPGDVPLVQEVVHPGEECVVLVTENSAITFSVLVQYWPLDEWLVKMGKTPGEIV